MSFEYEKPSSLLGQHLHFDHTSIDFFAFVVSDKFLFDEAKVRAMIIPFKDKNATCYWGRYLDVTSISARTNDDTLDFHKKKTIEFYSHPRPKVVEWNKPQMDIPKIIFVEFNVDTKFISVERQRSTRSMKSKNVVRFW